MVVSGSDSEAVMMVLVLVLAIIMIMIMATVCAHGHAHDQGRENTMCRIYAPMKHDATNVGPQSCDTTQ